MRRTDRLFELIQLFRGGRLVRAQDLADRMEVSVRTIYRDIDTLIASGIPIEGERGVGYMLREPIFLPPLTLTEMELEAFHIALAMLGGTQDVELAASAISLREKVDAVLPSGRQGSDFGTAVSVYVPVDEHVQSKLPVLRGAIRARRKLSIRYLSLSKQQSERLIRPLHLEFWGRVWTLTAWCEEKQDFRVFRLDRIEQLTETEETFVPEKGKEYSDYLAGIDFEKSKTSS